MPTLLVGGGVVLVGVVALAVILGGGRLPGIGVAAPTASLMITNGPPPRESVMPQPTPAPVVTPMPTVAPVVIVTMAPTAPTSAAPARSLPPSTLRPDPTATIEPTPTPEIARKYTVKPGDTIRSIASKFGLKPRDLRAVNDIGEDVQVGQRLRIPARSVPGA